MDFSLQDLVENQKHMIGSAVWLERDGTRVETSILIGMNGRIIEGLTLRASALVTMPDQAVSINLLYQPGSRSCTNLMRIEWNPLRPHTNPMKGPKRLKGLTIDTSHIHSFGVNFDQRANDMKGKNLPFAERIDPNPSEFKDLLVFAERTFKVEGLASNLPIPPWRFGSLFEG